MDEKEMVSLRHWLETAAGLPADVVYNLPRLTLLGGLVFTVQNHRGVVAFSSQAICLKAVAGKVTVYGDDLRLRRLSPEDCMAVGIIRGIRIDLSVDPSSGEGERGRESP